MNFLKEKQKQFINDNFEKWFSNSKVTDNQGEPLIVYHGTTHTFNQFKYSNEHNYLGSAYYFSDCHDDADLNYTINGADLKSNVNKKIEEIKNEYNDNYDDFIIEYEDVFEGINDEILEQLEYYSNLLSEDDLELNDDDIREILKEKLDTDDFDLKSIIKAQNVFNQIAIGKVRGEHQGAIMPCYLSFQNPFYYSKNISEGTNFDTKVETKGEIENLKEELNDYIKENLGDSDFNVDDFFEEITPEIESEIHEHNALRQSVILEFLENSNEINYLSEENAESFLEWAREELDSYYEGEIILKGSYIKFKEIVENLAHEYNISDYIDSFFEDFYHSYDTNDFNSHTLIERLRTADVWDCAYNEHKETQGYDLSGEFIKDVLIGMGYDGIIMDVDSASFNFDNLGSGLKHYLAFYPNQIKSAIGNCGDYSLDNLDIAAKIQAKSSIFNENIKPNDVKNKVLNLSKEWKNKPKIMFLNSVNDIPLNHKKEQPLLNKLYNNTKSLLSMGKKGSKNDILYVFTNSFNNLLEVEEVMAHEIIGHYALRKRKDKSFKKALSSIYEEYKADPFMSQLKQDYKERLNEVNDENKKLILADEFLAYKAESFNEPGLGLKIKFMTYDLMSKLGIKNFKPQIDLIQKTLYKNKLYINKTFILKDILKEIIYNKPNRKIINGNNNFR